MPRILIVAPSWVGDAVLAQPLFKRLHERHRELALEVLAPPWTRALFARMPEISASIDSPFGHGEFALKRRYALGRSLAVRHYDQAIVLPNSFKSALVPCFAGIPLRTGFVGEARWGLLNDARRLDKHSPPRGSRSMTRSARLRSPGSASTRSGRSRCCARAPNTAPPSAGRAHTSL